MNITGIDIAVAASAAQWNCFAAAGVTWTVTRAWHSYGALDANAVANLANAAAAGISNSDVYLFPCRGKDPREQVSDLLVGLSNSSFHRVWLDIEKNPSHGCQWTHYAPDENCKFLRSMLSTLSQAGVPLGVYSSHHSWNGTVGGDCALLREGEDEELPLWYPHYDRDASTCADFLTFGGWKQPYAKCAPRRSIHTVQCCLSSSFSLSLSLSLSSEIRLTTINNLAHPRHRQYTDRAGTAAIAKCGVKVDTSTSCV